MELTEREKREIRERVGRAYAPDVEHVVYTNAMGSYLASVNIGACSYVTGCFKRKESAFDELRGCLLELQDRIAAILKEIS